MHGKTFLHVHTIKYLFIYLFERMMRFDYIMCEKNLNFQCIRIKSFKLL
jgi:hypothetical protein